MSYRQPFAHGRLCCSTSEKDPAADPVLCPVNGNQTLLFDDPPECCPTSTQCDATKPDVCQYNSDSMSITYYVFTHHTLHMHFLSSLPGI